VVQPLPYDEFLLHVQRHLFAYLSLDEAFGQFKIPPKNKKVVVKVEWI